LIKRVVACKLLFILRENDKVRCLLCPHHCLINDGHLGICRVRRNDGGRLVAETYGEIAAIYLDPIEKKPLYHFYPGSKFYHWQCWLQYANALFVRIAIFHRLVFVIWLVEEIYG